MDDKVKIQNDISGILVDIIARLIFTVEEVYNMSVIFIVRKYTRSKVWKEAWRSKYFTYVARIRGLWDRT